MQVCTNGHYITDRYHSSPDRREDYCSKCGAETIKECPKCGEEIPGDDLDSSVIVVAIPDPPDYCKHCGDPFPWTTVPEADRMDVNQAISTGESEKIEFKEKLPDNLRNIPKEVVALANHKGGLLLIGVDDNGHIAGLSDIDTTEERVTGSINSNVDPSIRTAIEKTRIEGSDILAVQIPKADEKPYNVNGTFYIRSGTTIEKMKTEDLSKWF